jgi:glycosyltransferase involved in cell wall biosynthesis
MDTVVEQSNGKISGGGLILEQRTRMPLISCVLPAYNEGKNLVSLIPLLCQQLSELSPHYEVWIIDDGSSDTTAEVVIAFTASHPVNLLQLTRNFGKENAITAGLDHAHGDLVILMDADFQHPVSEIPRFYSYWQQGFDMVFGVKKDRDNENIFKRRFSSWFYWFMSRKSTPVAIEPDAGDFRLFDRRVVEALRQLPERTRFMKGLYSWVGFRCIGLAYQVDQRRIGNSCFNFWRLLELAVTGITSFTILPLRMSSAIGAMVSLVSILYGMYITMRTLVFGVDLPGWATLVAGISFLSGVQLLSIGILGEYIAKVFIEVKQRPTYIVGRLHKGINTCNQ